MKFFLFHCNFQPH